MWIHAKLQAQVDETWALHCGFHFPLQFGHEWGSHKKEIKEEEYADAFECKVSIKKRCSLTLPVWIHAKLQAQVDETWALHCGFRFPLQFGHEWGSHKKEIEEEEYADAFECNVVWIV